VTTHAPGNGDDGVLRETLAALEMPRHGLRKWFANNRAFCNAHGGKRVYGELLALLDECEAELEALDREDREKRR
jgi:hypothetical protein